MTIGQVSKETGAKAAGHRSVPPITGNQLFPITSSENA